MADLQFTAGIDINPVKKGLDVVQKELSETAVAAGRLDSQLKRSSQSFNSAGQSLQNLGRIAQDAPFGFIGIQNNINPLIESFQRLKTETGSTGKAFKSLAGSLVGAGGIGLAVSVATGVLTVLAQKGFFSAAKASTAAADEIKKFNKTIEDTKAAGIAAGLSLQGFVDIARDQTQSLETRNAALEKANKILGDHGEKLTLVNIATQGVTDQINKFTEATIQQSLATKFADRAADLLIKQADAQKALNAAMLAEEATRKRLTGTIGDFGGAASKELNRVAAKTKDAANVFKLLINEVTAVKNQLSGAQLSAAKLFGELDGDDKITGIIAKIKGQIKDLTDKQPTLLSEEAIKENVAAIKVLQTELDRLLGKELKVKAEKAAETIASVFKDAQHKISVLREAGDIFGLNKSKEQVAALTSAVNHLLDKFKDSSERQGAIVKLTAEIDRIELHEKLGKTIAAIPAELTQIPMSLVVTPLDRKKLIPPIKDITKELQFMTETLKDTFLDLGTSIGESIGKGLAGGGNFFKEALGGVFNIMGDFLIKLGKSAIVLSKLYIAISASKVNPFTGIVGGLAAIAAGYLLKTIKLPEFATGGYVSGPGTAKSDSINARLSNGEYVMNAATVSRFGKGFFDMINGGGRPKNGRFANGGPVTTGIGGFSQTIIPDVVVRGSDLLLVFDRATARKGRNG